MLKFDSVQTINGLSVYADDKDPALFYAIAQRPRFSIDNGRPVFQFLKYRYPIERSAERTGGGFLICDVEFGLSPAEEQGLREALQERLEEEWRTKPWRLTEPPAVKLGQLTFTRGAASVTLLDTNGALVEKVTNPASPSLFGRLVLPITAELSPEGATLLEEALQGAGGIVQVHYDLWTPVRLPPMTVRVWLDARKTMEYHQRIDVEERICREDDYTETIYELVTEAHGGAVEIDPGLVTDQKVIQAVRDWGNKTMADAALQMVLGEIPMENAEQIRKLYTEEDIENITVDTFRQRRSTFNRTYTEKQVMEWNPAPTGTLPNIVSMTGPDGSPYRWEDFSRVVDLNDPFFRTLDVAIRVQAAFDTLPLHSVEVKVEYDPTGQNIVVEPVFTSSAQVEHMRAFVANNNRHYRYQYQVNYQGQSRSFRSEYQESNDPSLVINAGDLGILDLRLVAVEGMFSSVASAMVSLWYVVGSDRFEAVRSLTRDNPEARWTEVIFSERRLPIHYQVTYTMADGREVTTPEATVGGTELSINDPFASLRTIRVRGFGDFASRIDAIFVDLTYRDEDNDYTHEGSVTLTEGSQFSDWTFPAVLADGGSVTWSAIIRFRDGTTSRLPEQELEGTTLLVGDSVLMRRVEITADLVDFTVFPLVRVSLRYDDEANGVHEDASIVFRGTGPSVSEWVFAYRDPQHRAYSYAVTYYPQTGEPSTLRVPSETDTSLVLPPRAP